MERRKFTREFKLEAMRLFKERGVVCSMSRSGNVWDNAAMESFFSSLKTERTARKIYRSRDEAKADVLSSLSSSARCSPG
jgi:transposase InsO family protein